MEIKKTTFFEGGKNEEGKTWSVKLELPVFDIERVDSFYEKVKFCLRDRAQKEGISIFSYLTPTFVSENEVSLYTDVLFCRGRELVGLLRLPDNRYADGSIVIARIKGAQYRKHDGVYTCKVIFSYDKDLSVRRTDYGKYILEKRLRAFSPSADKDVDNDENENG